MNDLRLADECHDMLKSFKVDDAFDESPDLDADVEEYCLQRYS